MADKKNCRQKAEGERESKPKPSFLHSCSLSHSFELRTRGFCRPLRVFFYLILQHPQEPREDLSSARIAELALAGCRLRVGLSWPNLNAAAGGPENNRQWGVLYLGTVKQSAGHLKSEREVLVLNPKGSAPHEEGLSGIVALDGNWRQAKALWWRNPWLLKLNRIVLSPKAPSLYGRLRREPRAESLSTIEAIALTLAALEHDPQLKETLLQPFRALLEKYRRR